LLHGGNDIGVRSAAADVSTHAFTDGIVVLAAWFTEQRYGGHDLTGRAISTLETVVFRECCLYRMQLTVFRQSLDRRDLFALVHDGKRKARVHAASVDVNGTGSALTVVAALLGAEHLQVVS
jgi:hypothetical protein